MPKISTRFAVTTAGPFNILGPSSTVHNTANATVHDQQYLALENISAGRCFLSHTSAGTTANGFIMLAFSALKINIPQAWNIWAFSSAGVTATLTMIGDQT